MTETLATPRVLARRRNNEIVRQITPAILRTAAKQPSPFATGPLRKMLCNCYDVGAEFLRLNVHDQHQVTKLACLRLVRTGELTPVKGNGRHNNRYLYEIKEPQR